MSEIECKFSDIMDRRESCGIDVNNWEYLEVSKDKDGSLTVGDISDDALLALKTGEYSSEFGQLTEELFDSARKEIREDFERSESKDRYYWEKEWHGFSSSFPLDKFSLEYIPIRCITRFVIYTSYSQGDHAWRWR